MAGPLSYALSLSTRGFTSGVNVAKGGLKGLSSVAATTALTLGPIAIALGGVAAAAGVGAAAFKSFRAAADFEQTQTSFRVLVGDVKESMVVLNNLKSFANSTPFEFAEVAAAGKKLLAMGSATGQLVPELRALGDVAAGMGIPLGDMSDLYGKIRLKGKIMGEELIQLSERGIPLVDMLAKKYGKSKDEIVKMGSEGKIGVGELQQALISLTSEGGKFHGMMAAQSATTNGLLSTLKSAVDDLMITLGAPINDAIKPILSAAIVQIQDLGTRTAAFFKLLTQASENGNFSEVLGAGLELAAIKFINTFAGGIRGSVAYLAAALLTIMQGAKDGLFSENNMKIFESVFSAAGSMMKAAILEGAAALAQAIGFSGDNLKSAAKIATTQAKLSMMNANGGFADFGGPEAFDASGVIGDIAQSVIDANEKGSEAYATASSKQLIDPTDARDEFAEKAKGLDAKLIDTVLNGLPKSVADATKLAVTPLKDIQKKVEDSKVKATPSPKKSLAVPGGDPTAEVSKSKGLLSAAESLLSRYNRQSKSDKGSFKDFVGRSGSNKSAVKSYAKINGISIREAMAKLGRGVNAAGKQRPGRKSKDGLKQDTQDTMLGVLKDIDGRLDNLAIA